MNKNYIHLLDLLITHNWLIVCDKIMTIFGESIPRTLAKKATGKGKVANRDTICLYLMDARCNMNILITFNVAY